MVEISHRLSALAALRGFQKIWIVVTMEDPSKVAEYLISIDLEGLVADHSHLHSQVPTWHSTLLFDGNAV
jgi:hypothetical protein